MLTNTTIIVTTTISLIFGASIVVYVKNIKKKYKDEINKLKCRIINAKDDKMIQIYKNLLSDIESLKDTIDVLSKNINKIEIDNKNFPINYTTNVEEDVYNTFRPMLAYVDKDENEFEILEKDCSYEHLLTSVKK